MMRRVVFFLGVILAVCLTASCENENTSPSLVSPSATVEPSPVESVPEASPPHGIEHSMPDEQKAESSEESPDLPGWDNCLGRDLSPEEIQAMTTGAPIERPHVDLADLSFELPQDGSLEEVDRVYTYPFWDRQGDLPLGLSRFCPSLSFVFPNERRYNAFLDVQIREKDCPVGTNFTYLTGFIGHKMGRPWGIEAKTTASYEDAADFLEQEITPLTWGDAPQLIQQEPISLGDRSAVWVAGTNDAGQAVDYCIFETQQYIYIFSLTQPERSQERETAFRNLLASIHFADEPGEVQPLWVVSEWVQETMTGTPRETAEDLQAKRDFYHIVEGEFPPCVEKVLEEYPVDIPEPY